MDEIKALFKITGPDLERDEILVGRQGLRVGRGEDNSLVLNHREISRQHMRVIWRDDERFLVEDLNSSNGIFFNDTRVPSRVPQELSEGDSVRLGPFVLLLERLVYPQSAPRAVRRIEGSLAPVEMEAEHVIGVPRDKSNWIKYLPAIYDNDDFMGRYLLIMESIMSPIIWMVDNFDLYLTPDTAPSEWLEWISRWFDILLLPELPLERQRELVRQIGWLFLRRGTRAGLQRLLELYCGTSIEIVETGNCHFFVRVLLSQSNVAAPSEAAIRRLIDSQRPAFSAYTLELL
jgi:phage tail-like protein